MAELFQIGVGTINHHLKAIFSEGELQAEATIRQYRIVQTEGLRQITREVEHYNLNAILAVGFRVRSHRVLLDSQPRTVDLDFEKAAKELKQLPKPQKPKP
jgi:hypothetical protein